MNHPSTARRLCILALLALASASVCTSVCSGQERKTVRFDRAWYDDYKEWLEEQPDDLRLGPDPLSHYPEHLTAQGLEPRDVETRVSLFRRYIEAPYIHPMGRALMVADRTLRSEPDDFLVRMVRGETPGRALDVGFAAGRNSIWLAQRGWDVTGLAKLDGVMLDIARREGLEIEGVEIEIESSTEGAFDWGSERWDLIVLAWVDVRSLLARCSEALRPGGLLSVEAFHRESVDDGPWRVPPEVVWDTNELPQIFQGFRILHYEDVDEEVEPREAPVRVVRLLAMKE